jgi:hypothetical protein
MHDNEYVREMKLNTECEKIINFLPDFRLHVEPDILIEIDPRAYLY